MFDFGDLSEAESGDEECPEEIQQNRKADASMKFKEGDVVKARFQQGCWYLGTVLCENLNGSYTICWKDGDDNDRVKTSGELVYIRPGDSKSARWSQGKRPAEPSKPSRPSTREDFTFKPAARNDSARSSLPTASEPARSSERAQKEAERAERARPEAQTASMEEREKTKWDQWEAQQQRFREELQKREEQEDNEWLESRMARLQRELREIDLLPVSAKKSRLRKLQLELHPDKQHERIRAKAQQLFLLVQGRWEANEVLFQRESQVKSQEEDRARAAAREERQRRQRSQEERERQRRQEEFARQVRERRLWLSKKWDPILFG